MVKEKQTRTYDQDGFRKRAACLCVYHPNELEILLVTSSRSEDHWIVPGGGVEPNEDPRDAAIRETEEEAGVKGEIKRCLGDFEVRNESLERKHRTSVFVLHVREELLVYEDSKTRRRKWFPIEEALRLLAIHKPVQCHYVKHFIQTSSSEPLCKLSHLNFKLQNIETLNALDGIATDPASHQNLQVKHYPCKDTCVNNNNTTFHTLIYARDVYSNDSDVIEDSPNVLESSNHLNSNVIDKVLTIGTDCSENYQSTSECTKKSDLNHLVKSSVNL